MEKEMIFKLIRENESVFNDFFIELGIKPAQRELLRAFLKVSQGRIDFEASRLDLANHLF